MSEPTVSQIVIGGEIPAGARRRIGGQKCVGCGKHAGKHIAWDPVSDTGFSACFGYKCATKFQQMVDASPVHLRLWWSGRTWSELTDEQRDEIRREESEWEKKTKRSEAGMLGHSRRLENGGEEPCYDTMIRVGFLMIDGLIHNMP